jgi:mono/diheme cytochrome c family protein
MVACVLGCHGQTPAPSADGAPVVKYSPDQIRRGAYVAAIAGCTTCHTPLMPDGKLHDHSRELGGGNLLPLPDGTVAYAPNISADRITGIGAWSDLQILGAIREGIAPAGHRLAPIMPYAYYNRMTDEDATALVAYLRTQPPIANRIPHVHHHGVRPVAVAASRHYVDRDGDSIAHGEYLATLMHCGACHTPDAGPAAHQPFAGGTRFREVVAPNITSDLETGIGSWHEGDIAEAVRGMKDRDDQPLRAPMADYAEAWSKLTESDARALAAYIASLPPVVHDVNREQAPPQSARR